MPWLFCFILLLHQCCYNNNNVISPTNMFSHVIYTLRQLHCTRQPGMPSRLCEMHFCVWTME